MNRLFDLKTRKAARKAGDGVGVADADDALTGQPAEGPRERSPMDRAIAHFMCVFKPSGANVSRAARPDVSERENESIQWENPMWQRFTERARKVVFYAQEEAGRLGENYVSTEHLLLGLVRENDSVAARLLDRMSIPLGRIRSEIERQVTHGDGRLGQDMQLTPRAKRVIDLAYDEARQLNNNYIGTEHLLLGLIREGEGLAGRVLTKLGVTLERTRREVTILQDGPDNSKDADDSDPTPDAGNHRPPVVDPDWAFIPEWSIMKRAVHDIFRIAQEAAGKSGAAHIGSEHLLIGILESSSRIGLPSSGFVLERETILRNVKRFTIRGVGGHSAPSRLSPLASETVRNAKSVADEYGHTNIGPLHIALALLQLKRGIAADALAASHIDIDSYCQTLQAELANAAK